MEENNKEKQIVNFLLKKGTLITEPLLEQINFHKNNIDISDESLEKLFIFYSKHNTLTGFFENNIEETKIKKEDYDKRRVSILNSYHKKPEKRNIQDFVSYFNSRFVALEKMLKGRKELENLMQIERVLNKKNRETVSIIGIVFEKRETKNGNLFLTLEDQTDRIRILINKNKPELFTFCQDLVVDEVIGVKGTNGEGIIFANTVIQPDIPLHTSPKRLDEEIYAIFLSDLHVGSKYFLDKDFNRFLKWINKEAGTDAQKEIVDKIKYIFIVGDLVDGVGIYPGQEKELTIIDIYEQYEECGRLLGQIPKDKKIIICPGNHDATRIAEPQLIIKEKYAKSLHEMENVIMVSNPSLVNINATPKFSGFNVLMYHGYSFDYFISEVDSLRNHGGYDRSDLVMKFLLTRRHLAPTHSSTLYIPDTDIDPLVIGPTQDMLPDFFITGHVHKAAVAKYRNITVVCGSCWQSTTPFQEKVGHHPEPSRIPIVNLQTLEVKILRFG